MSPSYYALLEVQRAQFAMEKALVELKSSENESPAWLRRISADRVKAAIDACEIAHNHVCNLIESEGLDLPYPDFFNIVGGERSD